MQAKINCILLPHLSRTMSLFPFSMSITELSCAFLQVEKDRSGNYHMPAATTNTCKLLSVYLELASGKADKVYAQLNSMIYSSAKSVTYVSWRSSIIQKEHQRGNNWKISKYQLCAPKDLELYRTCYAPGTDCI